MRIFEEKGIKQMGDFLRRLIGYKEGRER